MFVFKCFVELGYTSAEEAVEQLAKLLTNPHLWKSLSSVSTARAKELTLSVIYYECKTLMKFVDDYMYCR